MYRPRLIPCLLLDGQRFIKTTKFSTPAYIGDPINTVKIFNEKEVDEIIILDVQASKRNGTPNFNYVESLASECFMPLCYGGGVTSLYDAEKLIASGVEKISINTAALRLPSLLGQIARRYGIQSVVGSIDVKRHWLRGYRVFNSATGQLTDMDPVMWARRLASEGAGEILLTAVDRDGTMSGCDQVLAKSVSAAVSIPVTVCGGAASLADCKTVILSGGASAAAVGALFVYSGPHRAVLVNYPSPTKLQELFD